MQKNIENIRIVLVETSHPGNIGAIARAMKNMGLTQLVLVKPKLFPSAEAYARASGAQEILDNALVVDTLEQGLVDCELVMACSARLRSLSWDVLNPKQAAQKLVDYSMTGQSALIFGNEQSGLTNEHFELCQFQSHIPTNEDFSSLNLSHAVQVFTYEIRMAQLENADIKAPSHKLASTQEISMLMEHLMKYLSEIGFYKPVKSHILEHRLLRLIARVKLEKEEYNILRGIIAATQKKYAKDEN